MKKITPTILKRTGWHQILALITAGLLVLLSVLQLFWFEDFPNELAVLLPVQWVGASTIIASLFVIGQVLAVAYFLPLALSPLARWCGRVIAVLLSLAWLFVLAYALLQDQAAHVAYLGAKFDVELSWVSLIPMMLLWAMTVAVATIDFRKS